jgi:hypothetical protein
MTRYDNLPIYSGPSPFLKAFQKTDRVWDNPAKKEWADDVERRLFEITYHIDTRPLLLGYTIERSENRVVVYTFARDGLSKEEMAALARGQWPSWDKIVKAVPEFNHSTVQFDACRTFEWLRVWDVEVEMSRFRLEHGVFE